MDATHRFDRSQAAIKVSPNETFVLELPSAPSTGYEWTFLGGGKNIQLLDESFVADSDRMGAGGIQQFQFKATKSGDCQLSFGFGRPWEKTADETHEVRVTVAD